jgi:hypothetical protein
LALARWPNWQPGFFDRANLEKRSISLEGWLTTRKKTSLRFDRNNVIGSTEDIPQLIERWNIGLILFVIGISRLKSAEAFSTAAVNPPHGAC